MNVLVESFKRLYKNGQLTKEKLDSLLKENKISKEEYEYILS